MRRWTNSETFFSSSYQWRFIYKCVFVSFLWIWSVKTVSLCFPLGVQFVSPSERSNSALKSVKWFRWQKPPLSFWCLRSLCTSKWASPRRWNKIKKVQVDNSATEPPSHSCLIWPSIDVLPRRTSPSERRDHQLLQQEHQRHQRFRWAKRLRCLTLSTCDVTFCPKRLPLFSRAGDQRCSLLQRQVCQVGGQRGDRVSQTLLVFFFFKILKLLHCDELSV